MNNLLITSLSIYDNFDNNIINIIIDYVNEIFKGDVYNIINLYENSYNLYYDDRYVNNLCSSHIFVANKMVILINDNNIDFQIDSPIVLYKNNGIEWEYLFVRNNNPERIILILYVD